MTLEQQPEATATAAQGAELGVWLTREDNLYLWTHRVLDRIGNPASNGVLHHPEQSGHTTSTPRVAKARGANKRLPRAKA
jgi:hypothetical protein